MKNAGEKVHNVFTHQSLWVLTSARRVTNSSTTNNGLLCSFFLFFFCVIWNLLRKGMEAITTVANLRVNLGKGVINQKFIFISSMHRLPT